MALKMQEILAFGLVGLFLISFIPGVNVPILSNLFGAAGNVDETGAQVTKIEVTQPDKACGSTTMKVNFDVKYKRGTDVTAQNATVFVNGAQEGVFSEGATFTMQGGNKLRVYNNLDPAGTDYLGGHYEGVIPCTGQTAKFLTSETEYQGQPFMRLASGSSLLSNPGEVYEADSAAAAETKINDDFTANALTTELSLIAGETKIIIIRLKPVFEEGYGVADGTTIACRMTDSEIDQGEVNIQLNGQILPAGKYIPSSTLFSVSATNQTLKFWHMPPIDGKTTSSVELQIAIKADDTNQPGLATNFSCATFGTDYYEADDGGVKIDIEDRDQNIKIGRTAANEFAWEVLLS